MCRNLSFGGFFFLGPYLPVGSNFTFDIDLPMGRVSCVGEVRYQHSYAEEGTGVGVKFTRLGQEDLVRVQQYVQKYGG